MVVRRLDEGGRLVVRNEAVQGDDPWPLWRSREHGRAQLGPSDQRLKGRVDPAVDLCRRVRPGARRVDPAARVTRERTLRAHEALVGFTFAATRPIGARGVLISARLDRIRIVHHRLRRHNRRALVRTRDQKDRRGAHHPPHLRGGKREGRQ